LLPKIQQFFKGTIIGRIGNILSDAVTSMFTGVGTFFTSAKTSLMGIVTSISTTGKKVLPKIVLSAGSLLGGMGKWLLKLASGLKLVPLIGAIISIGFAVSRFMKGDVVGGIIEILAGLGALLPPPFGTIVTLGMSGINAFLDYKAGGSSKEASAKKVDILKSGVAWLGNKIKDIIFSIPYVSDIVNAVTSFTSGLYEDGFKALSKFSPELSSVWSFLTSSVGAASNLGAAAGAGAVKLFDVGKQAVQFVKDKLMSIPIIATIVEKAGSPKELFKSLANYIPGLGIIGSIGARIGEAFKSFGAKNSEMVDSIIQQDIDDLDVATEEVVTESKKRRGRTKASLPKAVHTPEKKPEVKPDVDEAYEMHKQVKAVIDDLNVKTAVFDDIARHTKETYEQIALLSQIVVKLGTSITDQLGTINVQAGNTVVNTQQQPKQTLSAAQIAARFKSSIRSTQAAYLT